MIRLNYDTPSECRWTVLDGGARAVLLPLAVGLIWAAAGLVALWTMRAQGFPGWVLVAAGVYAAAAPVFVLVGLHNALQRTRLRLSPGAREGAVERVWLWGGVIERTAFGFDEVQALVHRTRTESDSAGLDRGAGGSTRWAIVELILREPRRVIEVCRLPGDPRAEAMAQRATEILGVQRAARRPHRGRTAAAPTQAALSPAIEARVGELLDPGERVVWLGRPHAATAAARLGSWPTMVFGLLWIGGVAAFAAGPAQRVAAGAGAPDWAQIVAAGAAGLLLGWPGLAFLSAPLLAQVAMARTAYAVTDTPRGLIVRPNVPVLGGVDRLDAGTLARLRHEPARGGRGHLVVGPADDPTGFLGLDEPEEVRALVRDALRRAGASENDADEQDEMN